jgi:hypothetical protein
MLLYTGSRVWVEIHFLESACETQHESEGKRGRNELWELLWLPEAWRRKWLLLP